MHGQLTRWIQQERSFVIEVRGPVQKLTGMPPVSAGGCMLFTVFVRRLSDSLSGSCMKLLRLPLNMPHACSPTAAVHEPHSQGCAGWKC